MTPAVRALAPAEPHAALWQAFRQDPAGPARETLFETYLAFSRRIAAAVRRERSGADLDLDDLRQHAAEGLLQAIDRFDPDRGIVFEAYAARRIKGSVIDGISETSERRRQVSFRHRIRAERARSLSPDDPDAMTTAQALQALADLAVDLALGFMLDDVVIGEEPRSREPNAYETLEWADTVRRIVDAVETLPATERRIVRLHYLDGLEFARIAEAVGLSRGRVSQLHAAALQRLRKRLPRADHLQTQRVVR